MLLKMDSGGNLVVDNTPPKTGGPSPEARDNPGESYPNQTQSKPSGSIINQVSNNPGLLGGTGGGGGGGGTGGTQDWSSLLGIYGLPPDVAAKVSQIFAQTGDVNEAVTLALAYVRGTDWYAQTYPGIQEGIARGVVSNEADYRAYVNQLQQLNKQYYGTDISSQQIADYLRAGYSVQHVSQLFQGDAYVKANRNDLQYLFGAFGNGRLSGSDLQSLGQETAGLDSVMGQKLQGLLQKANQRMQTVFNGSLASPSLSLGGGGLAAPSLAGRRGPSDVGA